MKTALYPASFDPITCGHVDVIHRSLQVFDRVVVALAVNLNKRPLFSVEERLAMIQEIFADTPQVKVTSFQGLLVDYARAQKINTVIRGLRTQSDFEFEFQLASMNRRLTEDVDFLFIMADKDYTFISSSFIREIASHGGRVTGMVPPAVERYLDARFQA